MDDTTSASSASSSASDSDAYNTESARLYFGPVKTPERKFVASNLRLVPPQAPHSVRRSPRLSSPRPCPPNTSSTIDQESAVQDAKDIDLVARLVEEVEVEDEEQVSFHLFGTPQRAEDVEQDEPLSALADKILHAVDNPSPPPSPAAALKMFDPYHPANLSDSGEYEGELLFPNVTREPIAQNGFSLLNLFDSSDASKPEPPSSQDLIVFDTPDHVPSFKQSEIVNASQQPMSVDDFLSNSPDSALFQPGLNREPTLLLNEPKSGGVGGDLMSVDKSPEVQHHSSELQERHTPQSSVPIQQLTFAEDTIVTPLRRSTRPRKSVAPTPSPFVDAAPSVARTSIKKKDLLRNLDNDSSDERDDGRKSPSRALPCTPRRSRSPSKEPFSFYRELGSLSPASVSVLSSLAFNSNTGQTIGSPASRSAIEPPPALSFSVFAPPGGTPDVMSTPVPNDGPKRVPSSPKVEVSPRKFRLHSPAPNDVAITPARRIPIEQAIAEGQLSPEKAAQIGFKINNSNTVSSIVSTPARRILTSEKYYTPGSKSTMPRLESPVKHVVTHDESLAAPRNVIPSLKGKEKALAPAPRETSSSVIKPGNLPFPIVASASAAIEFQPVMVQSVPKAGFSPAKSILKVPSKIPRISKKPYARKVPEKSTNASSSTTAKQPESGKSLSTSLPPPSANSSTTKRPIRLVETAYIPVNPVSRPRPTISTTSTVLVKRKRENPSPSKPQITILRQVPSSTRSRLLVEPAPPSTDQQIYDTIRIRRVVTPPTLEHLVSEPTHGAPAVDDPPPQSKALEPYSSLERNDLPPASPMVQDHLDEQRPEPSEKFPQTSASPSVRLETPPPVSDSGTSGLRRTTRSRRSINPSISIRDTVPRKTTRRKPATQFDDVFSGMSITALKELTMTNTEKNQHYIAAKLETEVVRREGLRPESPAVKIRTIVQRQQEEKELQRAERAKRRARRSVIDEGSTSDISSDVECSSPTDHLEDVDMDTNLDVDGPPKHRRGAGDDEDYETPERPFRDVRARLFDDGSVDREDDRRVKWDRGLYTLVYLDEVKLGSRQHLKENRILKGILAPTSKSLRLDTLGNLVHADTPLTDLVPENVTVKKFVYDNDVAPAPEPPPKTVRSKSKRK